MDLQLEGKRVLVTGGASGLGADSFGPLPPKVHAWH